MVGKVKQWLNSTRDLTVVETVGLFLLVAVIFCAVVLALVGLEAFVLMWAWNFVVPPLFRGPALAFWQAVAVCLLLGVVRPVVWPRSGVRD